MNDNIEKGSDQLSASVVTAERLTKLETAQGFLMTWPKAAAIAASTAAVIIFFDDRNTAENVAPLIQAEEERKAEYKKIVDEAANAVATQLKAAIAQLERTTTSINETQAQIVEASAKLNVETSNTNQDIFASLEKLKDLDTEITGLSAELKGFEASLSAIKTGHLSYWPIDDEAVAEWKMKFPMDSATQEKLDALGDVQWFAVPATPIIGAPVTME